jgi:CMP-N,N'-diacetyllegionaminic acid synthase
MKIITIIPARGGSKSIPKKNIQILKNKPLVAYSIEYSTKSKCVDRTIVSTDSLEISDICKKYGAEVPFIRPTELAQDASKDYDFMRHALDYFERLGEIYDLYVLLRPTSPIRPKGLIEKAIKIFIKDSSVSSIRSVAKVKEHPYRTWSISSTGSMSGFVEDVKEPYNIPRQQLPDIYFQTGDIEVISRETILQGSISGSNIHPLIINHSEMIDIDHWEDFSKASELIKS